MCRYDDGDYDWYVESTNTDHVSDKDEHCDDCKRTIAAGEVLTQYVSMRNENYSDSVWVAQMRLEGQRFLDDRRPWIIVDEDRADELENDESVFLDYLDEEELNPSPPEYHLQCAQCYAGNTWLKIVCDQHVVMVTVEDLIEHTHEYEPAQLGPDFGTLVALARQQWRTRDFGRLIPAHVVKRLAEDAADFALANGLDAA